VNPEVTRRAAELRQSRVPFVHARVVRVERPTSAKPGDEAVVLPDGSIEGFVGGTCAEATVRAQSLSLLDSGEPLLLRILPGVEGMTTAHGAVTVSNPCLSGGAVEIFLEPLAPPARLLVSGDTPIAQALVDLAGPLGFTAEATMAPIEVGTDVAAVVVASHGRGEEQALTAALDAGVPYVALVASHRRGSAVLDALDVDDAARSRVSVPAGLEIGARTAPEIALSILAELVASRRSRRAEVAEGVAPDARSAPPGTAVDPICEMTVLIAEKTVAATVDGETAWFCCSGCRDSWLADHRV
jgi:xanthine dehydrogenase accessory factor